MNKVKLFFVSMLLLVSTLSFAQVTTSSMSGRVTDGTEALIGAIVKATHVSSGTSYGAVTNVEGRFTIQGMRPGGPYKVEIDYLGFGEYVQENIQLQLGETFSLNAQLTASEQILNEVVVTGNASKFTTEKTGASTNIKPEELILLPSINRSIEDFTRLSPYASGTSFGGRDGRSNNFTVDGAKLNNNFGLSSSLPGGGNPISLDALEEIQVTIAPYDVRQANFIGAGINAITKSGTNTFKGSAYTYQYNQDMRGNKIGDIDLGERDKESKSIYGVSLGGPIIQNKLFFFVNGELEKSPEQITQWRASKDGKWDTDNLISRASESDLNEFSKLLSERYGYKTGSYSDFPGGVENYKILARIDWNINNTNKLNLRYNHTQNDDWIPTNGNSSDTGLRLTGLDRISQYSMAFMNSTYSQRNVVNSFTAELNSRLTNEMSNQLLVTYTDINDTRGSKSDPFPFIDIMYGKNANGNQILEPYMSAGYELFTWNNGVKNKVISVADNYTYYLGNQKLTAGLSYEYQTASNAYMRNGTGYYRYASFEDFKNQAAPEAFALTYGYNGEQNPTAEVSFGQLAAYVQDEWNIKDNLKLTAGLRLDNTFFLNDMLRNKAMYDLDFKGKHIDSSVWPTSKIQFSPRLGVTWDVFEDQTLKVRGGTGLFTGRIPLVFFTNMPTEANMLQYVSKNINTTYNSDGSVKNVSPDLAKLAGPMLTNVNDMINKLGLPTTISEEDGVVGSAAIGVDPDFKMPQIWKTSVGVDYLVPVSFPLTVTVEGMYSKDINAIRLINYNIKESDSWAQFTGSDNRYIFPADYRYYNALSGGAHVLSNTSEGWGYTGNITINAQPIKALNVMAAYTHTESKEISGMPGSNANSAWQNVPSVNGPNLSNLQRSQYVTPDRIIGSLTYRINYLKEHMSTDVGLLYSGFTPYSYSYTYSNDMNGDGVTNDLIYIPKNREDIHFKTPEDADAFWSFLDQDKYLSKHKGEYAEAFGVRAPWVHRFDLKLAQNFSLKSGKTVHTLQVSLDILNVGNLLNNTWGVYKNMLPAKNGQILKYEGKDANNVPSYSFFSKEQIEETFARYNNVDQTWKLQLGVRYIF
jgi:outer membrane receptor protein involved in Fe transport